MPALPPRFRPFVPAVSLVALVLMSQSVGSEQRFGSADHSQQTIQGPSRGPVQLSSPTQGRGQQTPPGMPQSGQRPQMTAEQALVGWIWWKDEDVQKEMKLTSKQVQSINRIFESRVRYITPFNDELQRQVAELDRMAKERTVDIATYALQVSRAEDLRSKRNETRTVMLYEISKQLTPEQVQKLGEIWDRRRSGRGRGLPPRTW